MGQPNFIMKSLEKFAEWTKPFSCKSFGGEGKSLLSDISPSMEIGDQLVSNPLTKKVGDNPLIFFDSGAIMDFEKNFHDNSCGQGRRKEIQRDSHLYLQELLQTKRAIIPDYMVSELEKHRDYTNAKRRISDRTFQVVQEINKNSNRVISRLEPMLDREQVRFDIYWASKECFRDKHKKDIDDIISNNDKSLVVDAICSKNSRIGGKEITGSIVWSPDYHVLHLVRFLRNPDYNYQKVIGIRSQREKNGKYEVY